MVILMPKVHDIFRADFTMRVLAMDEETGVATFELVPDSRRYDQIEHNGEAALYDRYDKTIVPLRVLAEAMDRDPTPMHYAPPRISDAAVYIASRKSLIASRLANDSVSAAEFSDQSGEFLERLADHRLDFAIISIDLVGSTQLATSLDPETYARIIEILLSELAEIVPLFRGHVLKYTGDGLIAFIPGPSPNTQNDLAIDCALTMHALVYQALNPAFEAAGHPTVDVRLGVDAGEAAIRILGSTQTKRHADLIGEVVSLACKVQAQASAGEVWLGGVAVQHLHVQWRERLESVPTPTGWPYTDERGEPYPLHRVVR